MGVFNKKSTPGSPAYNAYQNAVNEHVTHYLNTWMPVQQFFTAQNESNRAGMTDIARGGAAAAADMQARQLSSGLLEKDEATGAKAGSGAYLSDMESGKDTTSTAIGGGLTMADTDSTRAYLDAVQQALGNYQTSADLGLRGMQNAAEMQQREAQLSTDIDNSRMQTVGGITANLGGMAISKEMGSI